MREFRPLGVLGPPSKNSKHLSPSRFSPRFFRAEVPQPKRLEKFTEVWGTFSGTCRGTFSGTVLGTLLGCSKTTFQTGAFARYRTSEVCNQSGAN